MSFGISGRKCSGKTTASNELNGYNKASFSVALKEYVAKIYGWDIIDLSTQSGKENPLEVPVKWNGDTCKMLNDLAGTDFPFDGEVVFKNRRHALTHIGTDIIRRYDPDFHVKEFRKRFSEGQYVCDDIRFPNELSVVKDMGYKCAYIVRPFHWEYSNHESEVSVRRKDFDHIIMNDMDESELIVASKKFFSGDPYGATTSGINHDAFYDRTIEAAYWSGVFCGIGELSLSAFNPNVLKAKKPDLIEGFLDFIKMEHSNIFIEDGVYRANFTSSLFVEDMKYWDIAPFSNAYYYEDDRFHRIPDWATEEENEAFFEQWVNGLMMTKNQLVN